MNARLSLFIGILAHDRLLDVDARVAHAIASLFDDALYGHPDHFLELTQDEVGLLANVSRQRANGALQVLQSHGLIRLDRWRPSGARHRGTSALRRFDASCRATDGRIALVPSHRLCAKTPPEGRPRIAETCRSDRPPLSGVPDARPPAAAALAALALTWSAAVAAQGTSAPIKIGLMLPYSGTYAGARQRDRERLQALRPGAGRQARRARDPVLQGRRRVRAAEGDRQRQQADQARQRRRPRRHRALGRRAGDGQGGQGQQHAARHPERRRRRDHRADVRRQHRAQLVLELAAGLRDGRRRRPEGRQAGDDDHLELRRRRRVDQGLHRRPREERRQGRSRTSTCRSRTSSSRRCSPRSRRRSPTRSTPSSPAAAPSSSSRTTPRPASTRRSRSTARASSPTARSRRRARRRRTC